ncbi:hypothetical protein [Arenicella xantha]|uniref:Uncharacterized protein n=1 Tax=Arenicella xantha TaxID=644221 RepID=A0A395JSH5_9GAMM|nr:hypothetical protein [Arenicella xantha]RBP53302.1 hypothetical protein DFR28_101688 [Arenicella xantha]
MASTTKQVGSSNPKNPHTDQRVADSAAILDPESKRIIQHKHWMRVMMEGQSTPDRTYQRANKSG